MMSFQQSSISNSKDAPFTKSHDHSHQQSPKPQPFFFENKISFLFILKKPNNLEGRNSAKEKKTSDKKMQMQKKDDQHHHHHRRSHDRPRACSWKMRFEKELESKAAEYPIPAIHQNPSFKKLQLESTGSPALCVRSEHPTLECCRKRADGDEKKPNIYEEAAAAIRRIDDHIPAHGVVSQTAAKALENPKLTGQTLSQKPFQEAKLKGRIPSQITELNGQPRQMTGHKSGPTESGQMMMSQKRSRAEKMDLIDRMLSQTPKARVTRTVALESPQLDGKAGPTQDALGRCHASSEMASGDLVKRHVGPQMKIERTFQKSGPDEQDQMPSQTIRPLPSQKSGTTRTAILTDKMLSRTCSKNGERIVTSGPQVVNHKVGTGLEKDLAHQTRDSSFQAIESESNGPDQKRTNDHRRNPASEIKNKVKRSMANLQKPTANGTMGPTMGKDNGNQTRDKVQTLRTKNLVGPLQVSGTNVPDQELGTRELNRTIETQSKVDGKTVSLKNPVLTETVGPTKKNLSDGKKLHKMKAVAPRKDEAIPHPSKHRVGQTYKCGPSHRDRMLSWSDDTVSEDSDLPRQMMSRMTLLHQKPSHRVHREHEQKNSVKQGRKVGPILEKQRSSHRGTSEMTTQAWDPRHKKLLPRHTMAKRVPSQTNSELTRGTSTSHTTDTAASRTSLSSSTPSQRTSSSGSQDDDPRDRMLSHRGVGPKALTKKKSLPRPMLTHHVRQASPRWMLSHHAVSGPPRRVGPTRADTKKPEKQGGLRRFKDKLAIIFHHHHHHHHHHHRGNEDSDDESSTPSDDHHRRSIWKSLRKILHHNRKDGDGELVERVYGERVAEASTIRAVGRAPRHQNHQHGHLHALLERLLRHVWHSSTKREKAGADRRHLGDSRRHVEVANKNNTKLSWWQTSNRHEGVKLANRKKARVMLGVRGAQNRKR